MLKHSITGSKKDEFVYPKTEKEAAAATSKNSLVPAVSSSVSSSDVPEIGKCKFQTSNYNAKKYTSLTSSSGDTSSLYSSDSAPESAFSFIFNLSNKTYILLALVSIVMYDFAILSICK